LKSQRSGQAGRWWWGIISLIFITNATCNPQILQIRLKKSGHFSELSRLQSCKVALVLFYFLYF